MSKSLSPVIKVDESACINCHMCIAVCPVKFCIDGSGEVVTINHDLCIGCGNCVSACTHNARNILDDTEGAFLALEKKVPMILIAAPAIYSSFGDKVEKILGWLKSLGVSAAFDVSFGAELTVKSYLESIKTKKPKAVIAQPCPAIVTYIELYQPELIPYLADSHSPMLHTAVMIRKYYPQYAGHKIMVLSPCIAKKREFEETGIGDYNVTFIGLRDIMEKTGVKLTDYPAAGFDNPPAERAALFSTPGGLMKTALREDPRLEEGIRKIEGTGEIYHYLKPLKKNIEEGIAPLLVDCLNCAKGCNGGTGTFVKDKTFDDLEAPMKRRLAALQKNYRKKITRNVSVKKIRKTLSPYWEKGLYGRKYKDLSENYRISPPSAGELAAIYADLKKQKESDHLNCAACGYNSCEMMAVAIFNGLNKVENCHFYTKQVIQEEKDRIHLLNENLKEKIAGSAHSISVVRESLSGVDRNVTQQSQTLSQSSGAVEEMVASIQRVARTFSGQQENLDFLIGQAGDGEKNMRLTTGAIEKITRDIDSIGEMIVMIDDISQQTNLLSMNAAIEAAHAGSMGAGFAVVASEIRKLAVNTAEQARSAADFLKRIISEAGNTSSISESTAATVLNMTEQIGEFTTTVGGLLSSVNEISSDGTRILNVIEELKADNQKVLSSSAEIGGHINDLGRNLEELITMAEKKD